MDRILVTGGTGTLGRQVVQRLRAKGHEVRVLSRRPAEMEGVEHVQADLLVSSGITPALAGVGRVLHLAGGAKGDDIGTRNLVDAARGSGIRNFVYISVIGADSTPIVSGVDRMLFGYIGAKREAERIIAGSGLPFTILRTSQFHDLFLLMASQMSKLPVIPVPAGMKAQPIDSAIVADRLAELTLGIPSGYVPELAGPHVYAIADLIRSYLKARGKSRPLLPLPLPGRAAKAFRDGANLAPAIAGGGRSWEVFLSQSVSGK